MRSDEWYTLVKDALLLTQGEIETPQIHYIQIVDLCDGKFTEANLAIEAGIHETSLLLTQAWSLLTKFMSNELQLKQWKSITIKGRKKALSIYSLGYEVTLTIIYEPVVDPLDVLKILLKHIFSLGYKQKYEIVGLIAAEGYPIWVSFPEEVQMDDFLFAISITSLLSLVERIDMEVTAGGIDTCIIQGTENLLLSVSFNPTGDLALAITHKNADINQIGITDELKSVFNLIQDPFLYLARVPESKDEDRERALKEILEDYSGEATEEEIDMLNVFDTFMLQRIEYEIRSIAKKYRANIISIGYLRKRMKLPSEVLSMVLEFLISNGTIRGKTGHDKKSGKEILVLDPLVDQSEEDLVRVKDINTQISDLFLVLDPLIGKLPKIVLAEPQEIQITETLSEFMVMLSLTDTDSLYLLVNELRVAENQLENSIRTAIMMKPQIASNMDDPILIAELEKRYSSMEERITELRLNLIGKAEKFKEDLLNLYQLLLRLIPSPSHFTLAEDETIAVGFNCSNLSCTERFIKHDNSDIWIKLAFFASIIELMDDFPDTDIEKILEKKNELALTYMRLQALAEDSETELKLEYYPFLDTLDDLLITNSNRDQAIAILQSDQSYFDNFTQCEECKHWFCQKHMKTSSRCTNCI